MFNNMNLIHENNLGSKAMMVTRISFAQGFSVLCVHVCMGSVMYVCRCIPTDAHVHIRSGKQAPSAITAHLQGAGLSLKPELAGASSACLCLPNSGVTGMCSQAWFGYGTCSGFKSRPCAFTASDLTHESYRWPPDPFFKKKKKYLKLSHVWLKPNNQTKLKQGSSVGKGVCHQPGDLSFILGFSIIGGKNWLPQTSQRCMRACMCTHKINKRDFF